MTTASPTTDEETVEFSTAREYFTRATEEHVEREPGAPRFAKSIVWVDQLTPLFVCEECHEHVSHLEWTGDGRATNYEEKRAEAYEALFHDERDCDICAGALPEKMDR